MTPYEAELQNTLKYSTYNSNKMHLDLADI
jgi:hypothetical protein